MPVRSLNSVVFRWPARDAVMAAACEWASRLRQNDPLVEFVGCIGSCARGDWGVGSDLDIVVILRESTLSALERHLRYEPQGLPVPSDLWVYTLAEWEALPDHSPHIWHRLQRELLDLTAIAQVGYPDPTNVGRVFRPARGA